MGNFSDLPADIMFDIFSRLPTESVLGSKSVSKTWNKVLQHPSFPQIHSDLLLSRLDSATDSGKFSFILKMDDQLYYLEYDDGISSHRLMKLNLNLPFKSYTHIIRGSCNGLVCITGLPISCTKSTNASYAACICNPITREFIILPALDISTSYYKFVDFVLYGFGYVASTNEYNVVRLYTFRGEHSKFAQIDVYTLGSGKGWRSAGKINNDTPSIARDYPLFANGFLYWFRCGRIAAFDLADEIFLELDASWYNSWGGVLGGHLSYTVHSKYGERSYVYLLRKKEDETFNWRQEFSLINTNFRYTTPIARTSNRTVLCYLDTKLLLYDLKSSSVKMLEDFGRTINIVIPHMNTLVSLKTFAEENTKTLEFTETAMRKQKAGLSR